MIEVKISLKITGKIFFLEYRMSKEHAHDNNKKKLKHS